MTYNNKKFFRDYLDIIIVYFVLGIPITIILYQTINFNEGNVILDTFQGKIGSITFLTSIISLISIRLSVLLKKRWLLKSLKLNKVEKNIPKTSPKLMNEYRSFLFGLLFASFFVSIMIWIFSALFTPESISVGWNGFHKTYSEIYYIIWNFIINNYLYAILFVIITFFSELSLKICGYYKKGEEIN